MITEELRKYIEMVLTEEQDDVLHEMANLGSHNHGISDVVIWVGKANKQHGLRIKVSNLKNRWSNDDKFVKHEYFCLGVHLKANFREVHSRKEDKE